MKLKHYQEKVIKALKEYLNALNDFRAKYEKAMEIDPDVAKDFNFPKKAYIQSTNLNTYYNKTNGLEQPLPDIYLKVPTGGGKTLLACHSIDLIQKSYIKKQTGIVLWIVPSTQIYNQTLKALKNREHPYRQTLDISSGGRTMIKEKTEIFTRQDIEDNLVIMLLMLPSANRQNKETLRMFRDSGGFTDFFPPEDHFPAHEELLSRIPNLDYFGDEGGMFHKQIKTSLGNTLKVLNPIIIIDEGHRAYGEQARNTIRNFNPNFILELSATPPPDANELVKITGRELHEEEMIKLDIHLTNKSSLKWKNTLLASFEKRNELEQIAKEYESNTGEYIRPICLIQVERTGKDQRGTEYIHAEDAKEYLIKKCNVPENHIAIKSSEKDDIEGIDLFAKECDIRYIITKQALQEGWDCSFAYILCILTNPQSATGITQLVGRILRQPNARKTQIKDLDECYIYTFRPNASQLVREIKQGLESEGLGDIAGRIVSDGGKGEGPIVREITAKYRSSFKHFEGKIYLPKFVIQEKDRWRDLIFETDILQGIDWSKIQIKEISEIALNKKQSLEQELTLSLSKEDNKLLQETNRKEKKGTLEIDEAFLARQLNDIVPNPWVAFTIGKSAIQLLSKKYDKESIASNFVFIIEELKKILEKERNRLSEEVFRKLLDTKKLCFFLVQDKGHHILPPRIKVNSNRQLVRADNSPISKSLFDYVPEEELNETEKAIAIYLDEQEQLLWWYRNRARQDFHIQGWRRNKIYPDFITATADKSGKNQLDTVYVLETKGVHLKENEDTRYKKNVFDLCNELGAKKRWNELFNEFPDHKFEFQVIYEDEWQNEINKMMQ